MTDRLLRLYVALTVSGHGADAGLTLVALGALLVILGILAFGAGPAWTGYGLLLAGAFVAGR